MQFAIIGAGPSALFILKRLVESGRRELSLDIFERQSRVGQGMPYGAAGSGLEHITNVSGSELPELPQSLVEWVESLPRDERETYGMTQPFHEEKVVPRLLFGRYLEDQFQELLSRASFPVRLHLGVEVEDVRDEPLRLIVAGRPQPFDRVIICTGHHWPRHHEGKVPGYFDSPYPPAKLHGRRNHPVALRGGSLTAVDAVRTLARQHGSFSGSPLTYRPHPENDQFKLVMHTRNGLLPCVRFHLDDPQVHSVDPFSIQQVEQIKSQNEGFVPLDLVYQEYFKKLLAEKDPDLHAKIRDLSMEQFVELALQPRQEGDPFAYFQAEYRESLESLAQNRSISWKEVLAILSFALNYPAKHFSAEDMLRLKHTLLPLISIVIAFVPQSSTQELLALHAAGRLQLLSVGDDSKVEVDPDGLIHYCFEGQRVAYQTYVDCVGQPPLPLQAFPFPSLIEQGAVSQARVRFRNPQAARQHQQEHPDQVQQDANGSYHLVVPGLAINDAFQPLRHNGQPHSGLYLMAVPYMAGHNPDYSGLDFCEEASARIVDSLLAL